MVVLSGDYMAVPDDRIDELEPVMTIVGGKVVYEAKWWGEARSVRSQKPEGERWFSFWLLASIPCRMREIIARWHELQVVFLSVLIWKPPRTRTGVRPRDRCCETRWAGTGRCRHTSEV